MDEKKQNEFVMFSEIWTLHNTCQEHEEDTKTNIRVQAKAIAQKYKSDFCNELIQAVMNEYARNLKN